MQLHQAWQTVVKDETAEWLSFDLDQWLKLPLALKRATLRRAIQTLRSDSRDIGFDHIETAITLVEKRISGTKATLPHKLQLSIEYDRLVIAEEGLPHSFSKAEFPYLHTDEPLPVITPGVTLIPKSDWQLRAIILSKNEFWYRPIYLPTILGKLIWMQMLLAQIQHCESGNLAIVLPHWVCKAARKKSNHL